MPSIPIIMPQLGESIAEANIINFLVQPGDTVEADQDLIEVETNKANMNVTSPCRGRIEKFTAQLNESYAVGVVLGHIEATQLSKFAAASRIALAVIRGWPDAPSCSTTRFSPRRYSPGVSRGLWFHNTRRCSSRITAAGVVFSNPETGIDSAWMRRRNNPNSVSFSSSKDKKTSVPPEAV